MSAHTTPAAYFGVFVWNGGGADWYVASEAVRIYKSRNAAEKYAAEHADQNLVVRSQDYVKGRLEPQS